ncbi:hypothetical protein Mfer_0759 [Methanothermus fervidus DSM 2088]|uniref:DUF3096 domain-containing protein n=1 Tax=Methanothermus fervidus (strain ATCC 43054 / DSM 2088 / JCM 10308 / V24 S) TaxID=523846 RepID=E3GZ26_METFV|nr:hypothetical protein [Methanothermus fervidus]ADP77558.1 hypothetical protein Mfer_0759 [Methanothermus fervidus DSM 2088]
MPGPKDVELQRAIGILAVIVGILMLIYPLLVGYLAGIFLIVYGVVKIFT